jgi:uncharacterized protein (DUF1330 family)
MKYYSFINCTPTTDAWIPDYVPVATKLVHKHGGKYLARTGNHEQLEGAEDPAALRVLVEWPSKEAAQHFMSDPEYAPHFKGRSEGAVNTHFLVAGNDDLTG